MESAPVDDSETIPLAPALVVFSAALDQLIAQVDSGALQGLDAACRTPCVSGP